MTKRQAFLQKLYPLLMKAGQWLGVKSGIARNPGNVKPPVSFYNLETVANGNIPIHFNDFRGKKVLLVNTASDCGYTHQLSELQRLHELRKDLVILGFPANDFKEQERGTDSQIASFCSLNYGVQFPLMQKSSVAKGRYQNYVYQWLSDKSKNGWNDKAPEWNFSKYLVNEQGVLTHYFGPAVSPLSNDLTKYL